MCPQQRYDTSSKKSTIMSVCIGITWLFVVFVMYVSQRYFVILHYLQRASHKSCTHKPGPHIIINTSLYRTHSILVHEKKTHTKHEKKLKKK